MPQDRKQRISDRVATGLALTADSQWIEGRKPGWQQLFLPDLWRNTVMATFVASLALVSYSTVRLWMPLFSVATASLVDGRVRQLLHRLVVVLGHRVLVRRLDDRSIAGRGSRFAILLVEAAVVMTIRIFAEDKIALWLLGMGWAWGFIGVWGPVTTYTAEMYPTRMRGVGNGFPGPVAF